MSLCVLPAHRGDGCASLGDGSQSVQTPLRTGHHNRAIWRPRVKRDMGNFSQFCRGDLGTADEPILLSSWLSPQLWTTCQSLCEETRLFTQVSMWKEATDQVERRRHQRAGEVCGPAGFSWWGGRGWAGAPVALTAGSFPKQSVLALGQAGPKIRSLDVSILWFCHFASFKNDHTHR